MSYKKLEMEKRLCRHSARAEKRENAAKDKEATDRECKHANKMKADYGRLPNVTSGKKREICVCTKRSGQRVRNGHGMTKKAV